MLDPSILSDSSGNHCTDVGAFTNRQVAGVNPEWEAGVSDPNEQRALTLAASLELLSNLDRFEWFSDASENSARCVAQYLSADEVYLLWRLDSQRGISLVARHEKSNDTIAVNDHDRLVIAAAEETASREGLTRWPAIGPQASHALLAVSQLGHSLSATQIWGVRLTDHSGEDCGVIIVVNDEAGDTAHFLRLLAVSLGSRLDAIQRTEPSAWASTLSGIRESIQSRRRNAVLGLVIAVLCLMLIPVRYRITTDLELRPIRQRFVAVPFDGSLQRALVRSGDVVEQDELLATINPREIDYELAGTRAELNRALQEKKAMVAEHDFAGSNLAELETRRLQSKADLLQYRRDNLEIRSPISGLVVSGDLEQSEGMPMTRGETLFEIAPLGEVVVELAVPEVDFAHVRPGMSVDFMVHAFPDWRIHGEVDRIHPRAELRDHDNVFIAELRVSDPDNLLRPGMRGRGKIIGDRHTIAWNLFHKAAFAVRFAMGW